MRARTLVAVLALASAGCGRSCGCVDGQTKYETLDGKVKVTLIRDVHWAGGKIPGPLTRFFLHIETTPPFDETIECDHVELAEDDAGKNIAYRCKDKTWTVLRLRGGTRRIKECDAPVGTGKKPELAKLEPVSQIVDRVLACASSSPESALRRETKELVRAVREDDGNEAAIKLALTLSAREQWYGAFDAWHGALDALDDKDRTRVMKELCGALTAKDAAPPAQYVRAARLCALDPPEVAEGALNVLRARLGRKYPENEDQAHAGVWERSLLWAAIVATEKRPTAAGALACAAADKPSALNDAIVGTILGRTSTACEAVKSWPVPCGLMLDCEDHLCTHAELLGETSVWHDLVTAAPEKQREEPAFVGGPRITLFATYASYPGSPLPPAIAIPNARRFYPLADPGEDRPWCHKATDAGTPCRCNDLHFLARCELPETETRLKYAGCSVHFDDVHRKIDDVTSTCEPEGSKCNFSSIICCAGLRCLPGKEVCGPIPD